MMRPQSGGLATKRWVVLSSAIGLLLAFTGVLAAPASGDSLSELDNQEWTIPLSQDFLAPWVLGERVVVTGGCWAPSNVGKYTPRLQVVRKGKWVSLARAQMINDAQICSDDAYPLLAVYKFVVQDLGRKSSCCREYRLTLRDGNSRSMERVAVQVYASVEARTADLLEHACFSYDWFPNSQLAARCFAHLGTSWQSWYDSEFGQYEE